MSVLSPKFATSCWRAAPGRTPPFDVFEPVYRVPEVLEPVGVGLVGVFLVLLVVCAAAMIVRYRRSASTLARAQVRWFALGSMILPLTLLLC